MTLNAELAQARFIRAIPPLLGVSSQDTLYATIKSQDLRRMAAFTPSPLMGEGWGEGETLAQAFVSSHILTPSPQPSPARGEGAKSGFCVNPNSIWVNGNWRITFRFEDQDAILVDYQDYH